MPFYYCDYDDDYSGDDGAGGDDPDDGQDYEEEEDEGQEEEDDQQGEDADDLQDDQQSGDAGDGGDGAGGGDGGDDGGDGDGDDSTQYEPEISPDATEEDFHEDEGNWTSDDYAASAERLFGQNEFFGESIDDQLADAGFSRHDDSTFLQGFDRVAPGSADTVRLYERDGQLHAFGFIPMAVMMLLQRQYSGILFDNLNVTVPQKGDITPPQPLPAQYAAVEPKPAIDLRPKCTPVGDQASTSRCAAFAWTHAVELTRNLDGKETPRLSPSYSMLQFQRMQGDAQDYAYAHEGGTGTVGGPDPGNVLRDNGTCRQDLWPDDVESPKAGERFLASDAQQFRLDATPHPIALDDVKKVLSAECAVQVGMNTGPSFANVGRDGVISAAEAPSGRHGRHAMLVVGYQGNYYTVKNSWGPQWGDNGYCYVPKSVFAEAEAEFIAVLRQQGPPAPPSQPSTPTQSASSRQSGSKTPEAKPAERKKSHWWSW